MRCLLVPIFLCAAVACGAARPNTPLQGMLPVSWRLVGPGGGGAFKSLSASRWNRNRLFAGSDVGGFYISDDRGLNWRMANIGLEDPYVATIAEHPTEANTLFVGTRGGVYVTHDLGKTWRPCRNGFPRRDLWAFSVTVRKIVFAPDDPQTVYALVGSPGDRTEKKGLVYVSHDGGERWNPLVRNDALPPSVKLCDLSIHNRKPREMLIASNGGVFLSTDGGASWSPSNDGLPSHLRTLRVARAPSNPDVVYVTLRQKCGETPWNAGIYRSSDGGRTWMPRCKGLRQSVGPIGDSDMRSDWTCEIVVDPTNADVVYAGGKSWADPDMYKTTDGGLSWRKTDRAVEEGWIGFWGRAVDCLAISSADPKLLVFGTTGGVYVSEDAGESWTQRYTKVFEDGRFVGTGLDDTCLHGVTPDPARPGRFYFGYFDIGLLVTEDGGRSFRRCMNGIPSEWENSCFAVAQAPDDPDRLWASFGAWTAKGVGGIVATSFDGGCHWRPITGEGTGFCGYDPRGLACFGTNPNYRLVHLSPDGVVSSNDGGVSWKLVSGLFEGERPTKLLVRDGESLYCVTERNNRSSVWRSADRGISWARIASARDGIGEVYGLSAQGDDVVVSARDTREAAGGVWCSSDGGKTFRRAVTDRFCSGALVTGGYYLASMTDHPFHDDAFGGGIIASSDKGRSWWSLNTESLQNLTVTSLHADPSDPLVVWAGTGGGSAFVGRLPPLPKRLTCEFRDNPDGVDVSCPRLAWELPGTNRQRFAWIQVARSKSRLLAGKADMWDSGKQEETEARKAYAGAPLKSSETYWWRVKVWDVKGVESSWSAPASWTQGLGSSNDWSAKWIAANEHTFDAVTGEDFISPAFETRFVMPADMGDAVMHLAAPGFGEVWLNGVRVGDRVLDPAPTDFAKTVLYSSTRVSPFLRVGTNVVQILSGHGWYDVRAKDAWDFDMAPWRSKPCVRLQIDAFDAEGRRQVLCATDGLWRQVASPVGFDDVRECGEVIGAYDSRCPDFGTEGLPVRVVNGPSGVMRGQASPPTRVQREVLPVRIEQVPNGWRVTFPEIVSGWVRLTVRGAQKGRVVSVLYDERDYGIGKSRRIDKFYSKNASHSVQGVPGAFQKDRFVCSGKAAETFEPRFTWKGFMTVLIEGLSSRPEPKDVVARYVRTDYEETGRIETSNPQFNELLAAATRSYHANFTDGIPTDCPTREKLGWTGDAAVTVELGQYLCENTSGYEKWIRDIIDAQRPSGELPGIVPTSGWGFNGYNGPIWDSALAFVPWTLYAYRGDRRVLEESCPFLVRLAVFNARRNPDADGLVDRGIGDGGDWWPPDWNNMPSMRFTASAYQYATAIIAARSAEIVGDGKNAAMLCRYAGKLKSSINRRFCKEGVYDCGNQTAQAVALAFGLVPGDHLARARQQLVKAVERSDCHFDCGIIGVKHVLRELSRIGRTDLAYAMLMQRTHPTLMQTVLTTPGAGLWDEWTDAASSRCHQMFADFEAWAYQYLGGIRPLDPPPTGAVALFDSAKPGMSEFEVAPNPIRALDFVKVQTRIPTGVVESEWRRQSGRLHLRVVVPSNAVAHIRLPVSGERRVCGSGVWFFEECE